MNEARLLVNVAGQLGVESWALSTPSPAFLFVAHGVECVVFFFDGKSGLQQLGRLVKQRVLSWSR